MKKLLALVLVLSVASLANAALTTSLPDTQTVDSGATVTFSVSTDVALAADTGATFFVVIDAANASFDETLYTNPNSANASIVPTVDSLANAGLVLPAPAPAVQDGMFGNVTGFGVVTPAGILIDNLKITVTGNTLVQLWLGNDAYEPVQIVDTATINVIPEPITMTLLGLGGLVALRRRR